jgi:hypothetical protein
MKNIIAFGAVMTCALGLAAAASATPVTLTGKYVQVGVSDYGTFGSNGNVDPGILVDPTGKGAFNPGGIPNDVLTPGTPHDGFAISSTQTGFRVNDNSGVSAFGTSSPTLLTGAAKLGYDNAASWSGTYSGVSVTNSYYFSAGSTKILILSTIANNTDSDLTNLYFGRSEDPDPDVNRYGSFTSINTFGDKFTAGTDLVTGSGPSTGLTIGILNGGNYKSNTEISFGCCSNDDPSLVFNGTGSGYSPANIFSITGQNSTDSDNGLQMAWSIGTLRAGQSAVVNYDYVFGADQSTVTAPAPGGVPEPATWALMLVGIGGIGAAMRNRRQRLVAA